MVAAVASVTSASAQAATGCRVDYRWQGGFDGDVTVTNLASPVPGGFTLNGATCAGRVSSPSPTELSASAFPNGTPWASPYTGGSPVLWAPDISYRNGQYYMYYAASTSGSRHSAIFLATSTTGAAGWWTNRGLVIETATSSTYNAIDPNLIVDDAGNGGWTSGRSQAASR